jgi:hypothetical protein
MNNEIDWERVRAKLASTIEAAAKENVTLIHYNSKTGEYWRVKPDGDISVYDPVAERAKWEPRKRLVEIHQPKFVVCVFNGDGLEETLALHKVYRVLGYQDKVLGEDDKTTWVRIIDENGDEDVFSPGYFVPVGIPEEAEHHFDRG